MRVGLKVLYQELTQSAAADIHLLFIKNQLNQELNLSPMFSDLLMLGNISHDDKHMI